MTERLEYGKISPTYRHAEQVKLLTRQDVELGEFPDVDTIANPLDKKSIIKQAYKLAKRPQKYTGAFHGNDLVGYMTFNNWRIADQSDFATPEELESFEGRKPEENLIGQYGIFGLVVSNQLELDEQQEISRTFFSKAASEAVLRSTGLLVPNAKVNIVLHDHDPLREMAAEEFAFKPVRRGVVSYLPELEQTLYQKTIELS